MVDPDRSLLEELIESDEATLPFRTARDPATGGQGRSPQGKMRIAGAVELSPEGEPRRIRLAPIGDFSARSLRAFVAGTSAPEVQSSRTSPGTVRKSCLERKRPINIWCDRKQREKPLSKYT